MEANTNKVSGDGIRTIKAEPAVIRGHIDMFETGTPGCEAELTIIPSGKTVKVEPGSRVVIKCTTFDGRPDGWSEALFPRGGEITGPAKVVFMEEMSDDQIAKKVAKRAGVQRAFWNTFLIVSALMGTCVSAAILDMVFGMSEKVMVLFFTVFGISSAAALSYWGERVEEVDLDQQTARRVLSQSVDS